MSFSSNSDHRSKNASYNTVYASPKKYGTFSTLFLNKISRGRCIVAVPSISSSSLTSVQIVEASQVNVYNNYKTVSKFFTTSNDTNAIELLKDFIQSITNLDEINTMISGKVIIIYTFGGDRDYTISKNCVKNGRLKYILDEYSIPFNITGLVKDYALFYKGSKKTQGYYLLEGDKIVSKGIQEIYTYCKGCTDQYTIGKKFTLVKCKSNVTACKYYDIEKENSSPVSIITYIESKNLVKLTSDTPNDDYTGGGGGGGMDYTPDTSPTTPGADGKPLTGNSIGQVAYINNFTKFKLTFKFGKDARQDITEPFKTLEEKAFLDTDDLIIRNNIPKSAIDNVSSNITLSNYYYSYSKITSREIDSSEFFGRLDDVLNLAIEDKKDGNIWVDNSPPLVQLKHEINKSSDIELNWENNPLKWKLVPMSALAVKRQWYNTLTDYITKDNTLEIAQNSLTLKDCVLDKNSEAISLKTFYVDYNIEERAKYKLLFFDIFIGDYNTYESKVSLIRDFNEFLDKINPIVNYAEKVRFNSTFVFEQKQKTLNLYELKMFEAYTRGHDFIQEDYTTVRPAEQDKNGNKYMDFDDNYFSYKYTGRKFDLMNLKNDEDKTKLFELPQSKGVYCALVHEKDLLTESDVTLGETYGEKKYFTEVIKYYNSDANKYEYKDTFKVKNYLDIVDSTKYTEDDIECITAKIDLTQCKYYDATKATYANKWCDCSYGGLFNKECIYQKLGYCPYRFDTEKHPRRIRTLSGEKSNRFNLIQELSSVFKIYPQFYIEFDKNGRVILDENGYMKKHIFFITEKGNLKNLGFRYEKNLNSITRSIDSTAITTKMFVEDIDSEYSDTGLCSIQTAEDNIGKTNYLLDFSYYTKKGIIDPLQITRDIYGITKGDMAFLPTIGYYNTKYDEYTNLIINMTGETMTEMKAKNDVSVESITACLVERQKLAQKMYQFKVKKITEGKNVDYTTSDTYKNYLEKYKEQSAIMWGNIEDLFFSNDYFNLIEIKTEEDKEIYHFTPILFNLSGGDTEKISEEERIIQTYNTKYCKGEFFWRLMIEGFEEEPDYIPPFDNWETFKEKIVELLLYPTNGNLGQYKSLNDQVKYWKLERAKWLNKINDIADKFYKKYEPYIKEGTWTDDNYLTDNEYFWAANNVLSDSCKPKVSYTVNVSDISTLDNDYLFDLSDTSFVEDVDMFGINQRTGLPNQQKVIISGITEDLDNPTNNSIEIKNFTTSFDELFESISASVQSLTFNENTYKRAANFTATKYISKDSLQGTLFDGDLTLMDTNNENIVIKDDGISGKEIVNTSNQYKLTGEGLFFSKDGGQTWDMGVGPGGINADYIKFGQLDASKIQIVDGNYIYFLWDKSGITAYRNPATSTNGLVDFTRFNKYGLSLIENNKIRLRAGYEFKNGEIYNVSGDYQTENELTNQNVGFYLYNDNGQSIFRTETASLYGDNKNYSARMSLNGEMFITNRVLDGDVDGNIISKEYEYVYSGGSLINYTTVGVLYNNELLTKIYQAEDNKYVYEPLPEEDKDFPIYSKDQYMYSFYKKVLLSEGQEIYYYFNSDRSVLYRNNHEKVMYSNMNYEIITVIGTIEQIKNCTDIIKKGENLEFYVKEHNIQNTKMRYNSAIFKRTPEKGYELQDLIVRNTDNIANNDTNTMLLQSELNDENNSTQELKYDESKTKLYTGVIDTIYTRSRFSPDESLVTYEKTDETTIQIWDLERLTGDIYKTDIVDELKGYITQQASSTGCTFWDTREMTGESRATNNSSVKTNEVGIFINNKTSINGGSQIVKNYNLNTQSNSTLFNESSNDTDTEESTEEEIQVVKTVKSIESQGIDIDSDDFVIIGDSITAGLSGNTPLKSRAIGVYGASMSVKRSEDNYDMSSIFSKNTVFRDENGNIKVKNVAIFFGTNDIGMNYSKENYKKYTSEMLDKILTVQFDNRDKSEQKFYMLSPIYGTFSGYKNYNTFISNYKEIISELNNEGYKLEFVDINEKTKDVSRQSDGCHPTAQGYNMLYNILKDTFSATQETTNTDLFKETIANIEGLDEARNTILAGAERVYMLSLSGEDENNNIVYNNILTVLKNGCMYIGGTVNDFYGRPLKLNSFGQMPDEVRINDAKIIMSNNGMVWMNFKKVFMIDDDTGDLSNISLWQAIQAGGGGKIEDSDKEESTNNGLPSGYYLIDPIKD